MRKGTFPAGSQTCEDLASITALPAVRPDATVRMTPRSQPLPVSPLSVSSTDCHPVRLTDMLSSDTLILGLRLSGSLTLRVSFLCGVFALVLFDGCKLFREVCSISKSVGKDKKRKEALYCQPHLPPERRYCYPSFTVV